MHLNTSVVLYVGFCLSVGRLTIVFHDRFSPTVIYRMAYFARLKNMKNDRCHAFLYPDDDGEQSLCMPHKIWYLKIFLNAYPCFGFVIPSYIRGFRVE